MKIDQITQVATPQENEEILNEIYRQNSLI